MTVYPNKRCWVIFRHFWWGKQASESQIWQISVCIANRNYFPTEHWRVCKSTNPAWKLAVHQPGNPCRLRHHYRGDLNTTLLICSKGSMFCLFPLEACLPHNFGESTRIFPSHLGPAKWRNPIAMVLAILWYWGYGFWIKAGLQASTWMTWMTWMTRPCLNASKVEIRSSVNIKSCAWSGSGRHPFRCLNRGHKIPLLGAYPIYIGAPQWCLLVYKPMNTIVISMINHSYLGYKRT